MFQVQPARNSPFLPAAGQQRAGVQSPIWWAAMRGRLVFPSIFRLGFTETTVKGRHGSTTVSQRAFSSWADEENPTSYSFSPELLHCGQSMGPALGEPMHSAPPGQVGVLALVAGGLGLSLSLLRVIL